MREIVFLGKRGSGGGAVHDGHSKPHACRAPGRDAEALAMQLLERVRIHDQVHKYPAQLCGGQQQRVAIARALAMRPKIIDPEMIKEVLDVMVEELAKEDMTMVVVTHEMGFARTVADRVVFMDEGEIVEMAPPAEFFAAPKTKRVRAFLSQILGH
jgi:general L-amino acid transport system ATP-binding protein